MSKRKGRHPDKELTAVRIRQIKSPGRYPDGNGLYLVVSETGSKRWILRLMVRGRRRDMGLGGFPLVPLAEARELAANYRRMAREGEDPIEARSRDLVQVPTFAEAAHTVHQQSKPTWKNAKHGQQWINKIETYANPVIGKKRIDHITSADIQRVLSPIWTTKAETARRLRQRMSQVFEWASTMGHRRERNPVDGIERGLPKQVAKAAHHAAMPYADVPDFLASLRHSNSAGLVTRRALEFLVLTASRTSEVLKATWDEIDFDADVWTIDGSRMKAGREHRVPLTPRMLEILTDVQAMKLPGDYVFPGSKPGKPLSNMTFNVMLRRMELPYTPHGFRSSFRDWVAEKTEYPNEVAEMALAHIVSNKVEAAYRRGDMLDRRRNMMEAWEKWLMQKKLRD